MEAMNLGQKMGMTTLIRVPTSIAITGVDFQIQISTINVGLTLVEDFQNGNSFDNSQGGDTVRHTNFFVLILIYKY